MKKTISVLLIVVMILAIGASATADQDRLATTADALEATTEQLRKNPVYELYSAEGFYTDSVGNETAYSYHVPQIFADSPDADEINAEIAENFGKRVEPSRAGKRNGMPTGTGVRCFCSSRRM